MSYKSGWLHLSPFDRCAARHPRRSWSALVTVVLLSFLVVQGSAADSGNADGYKQIMARWATDPGDTPANDLPFRTVQLQILASEITLGENGPKLPVYLNYSNNGSEATTRLFSNGDAVQPGQVENFSFKGSINGFLLVASCRDHTIPSDDSNCLVMRNHDDVQGFLTRHHINKPFGDQLAIGAILKPYMRADGTIKLLDTQRIVLFELGTRDPTSPAYDFQDLVVLLDFSQPMPFEPG